MRIGEILALTPKDVDLSRRVVQVRPGETAAARRTIPLSLKVIDTLKSFGNFPEGAKLKVRRSTAKSGFHETCERIRSENLHFHNIHHKAISRLAAKTETFSFSRIIGHIDPKMLVTNYMRQVEIIETNI